MIPVKVYIYEPMYPVKLKIGSIVQPDNKNITETLNYT